MAESKHTAGPWEAAERGDYGDFDGESRVILGDDRRIAVVQHSGSEEDEANALLIASAPTLLSERDSLREENERLRGALEAVEATASGPVSAHEGADGTLRQIELTARAALSRKE